jgi:tetratricopeptide (TPR) repeat protein
MAALVWLCGATYAAAQATVSIEATATPSGASITLVWPQPVAVLEVQLDNRSLMLRFDHPLGDAPVDTLLTSLPDWVSGARYGYDTVLIEAIKPVRFAVSSHDNSVAIALYAMTTASSGTRKAVAGGNHEQRLDHLNALVLAESGDPEAARRLLEKLAKTAPNDAAIMLNLAQVTEQVGDWRGALAHYRTLKLAPDSDPARQAAARQAASRLLRGFGPYAKADIQVRDVDGADRQTITTVSGRGVWGDRGLVGIRAEDRRLEIDSIRRANGRVEAFDDHRGSGELWFGYNSHRGSESQVGLLVNPVGNGFRLSHQYGAPAARTRLDAIYHQAYFAYVEGIIDDALRDRLALSHRREVGEHWHGELGLSANHYRVMGDEVGSSGGISAGLHYGPVPGFLIAYTLDIEAMSNVLNGGTFEPLPLSDREVHALGLTLSGRPGHRFGYDINAGYAHDRLNDGGAFGTVTLRYGLGPNVDVSLRASRAINVDRGEGGEVLAYGLSLTWKPALASGME